MILIDNEGITNPHLNLALEEFALRHLPADTDYLLFYINDPSIIIGRNQNTLEEINHEYVKEQNIHVVRRVSGGGAVYHDHGNLNFSFITDHDIKSLNNFEKFTRPVVLALQGLGIPAELKGRNDLVVGDKKISGNAQFSTGKRMFSHGTLLWDSALDEVAKALQVKMSKIQSKGHKSVRARVANISTFFDGAMDIHLFKKAIMESLYHEQEGITTYRLNTEEWEEVHRLKAQKYDTWEWNFGNSPKFNIQRVKRFPIGEIDLRIFVEKGHIREFTVYGDFFNKKPIAELETRFQNIRYTEESVLKALDGVQLEDYFGAIDKESFVALVYGSDETPE